MPIPDAVWSKAFAKQSLSDLQAYDYLCAAKGLPHCHRLHYLQMYLEKLGKAYMYGQSLGAAALQPLQTTHKVIAKTMPLIIHGYWRQANLQTRPGAPQINRIRDICRDLDLLAPTVDDDGRRPDNVEYPWPSASGAGMVIPSEHTFRVDERLRNQDGKILLKVAAAAAALLAAK